MTTRSLFKIEQIEEKLQEFAHQIPRFKKVIGKLDSKNIEIDFRYSDDGEVYRIHLYGWGRTGKFHKYGEYEWEETESWGFTVEPKDYMNSPHATKITGEDEKGLEWLNKLMEGVEPEPRFRLEDMGRESDRREHVRQLREELGREPTEKEIETSLVSVDEGQG